MHELRSSHKICASTVRGIATQQVEIAVVLMKLRNRFAKLARPAKIVVAPGYGFKPAEERHRFICGNKFAGEHLEFMIFD